MFKKLLSNLPFNPSLIDQVAFYSKRLKQEASVRRLGFLLVALTMLVQLFAVLSPAQPSLAVSGNDLVPGGVSSQAQLIQHCQNNDFDYRTILGHFGITCDRLNGGVVTNVKSTDTRGGQQQYSMGRIAQGSINSSTHKATDEFTVNIAGVNYYMRLLHSWDSGAYSSYKALDVSNVFGVHYLLLFSCGNLVQFGKPAPPPPPKKPPTPPKKKPPCTASVSQTDITSCIHRSKNATNTTQHISKANNTQAKPGDEIIYTLITKNTANVPITKFFIQEDMRDVLEYADITNSGGGVNTNGVLIWHSITLGAGKSITHWVTVKVKNPLPKTPEPCNPAVTNPCPGTGSFDLIMTNTYGNTINVHLKPPPTKIIEHTTTKTLANTGPGTSLIIGFSITAIVGYFFARTRLMAKELDLVRKDYTSGGM